MFPQTGQDFGRGAEPREEHTRGHPGALQHAQNTRKMRMFLPKIVAYPFASLGNPRVWTQIMSLGHTNLSYYKAKKQHIQRQNSERNILAAAVLVDVARKMATGSSETSRCFVLFQKNNKYPAQFTHPSVF